VYNEQNPEPKRKSETAQNVHCLFIPLLTNGLKKLTALTEISKTEAIYAVICSVPFTGPSN
jgi:hypothetical protein